MLLFLQKWILQGSNNQYLPMEGSHIACMNQGFSPVFCGKSKYGD